ncbi:MAG: hypothetical protein F4186_13925 [Boseongicola sp. SB0676_bin_33]|uniref:Uncharacterized protein n=1 Tax=Boseongicola sp. SB0664_bin_43 TaxID=2604844 RepID=A0A6B0Y1Q3_9RHOB|nr:hypothetical protein [Boseongicola sp. SB0664_bin_43]MYF90318.1 hypothetical protein [Boseongicola sp. SB0676_bin_33]MYK30919.1 hypothetical protein [Boseongicola sp. SB0670_bin_30]
MRCDAAFTGFGIAEASPVTPVENGLPPHSLHTHVWTRPVSCLARLSAGEPSSVRDWGGIPERVFSV